MKFVRTVVLLMVAIFVIGSATTFAQTPARPKFGPGAKPNMDFEPASTLPTQTVIIEFNSDMSDAAIEVEIAHSFMHAQKITSLDGGRRRFEIIIETGLTMPQVIRQLQSIKNVKSAAPPPTAPTPIQKPKK